MQTGPAYYSFQLERLILTNWQTTVGGQKGAYHPESFVAVSASKQWRRCPWNLTLEKSLEDRWGLEERESLSRIYLNTLEARDGSQLPTDTTACLFLFISGVVSEPQSLGFDFTPGKSAAKSTEL